MKELRIRWFGYGWKGGGSKFCQYGWFALLHSFAFSSIPICRHLLQYTFPQSKELLKHWFFFMNILLFHHHPYPFCLLFIVLVKALKFYGLPFFTVLCFYQICLVFTKFHCEFFLPSFCSLECSKVFTQIIFKLWIFSDNMGWGF